MSSSASGTKALSQVLKDAFEDGWLKHYDNLDEDYTSTVFVRKNQKQFDLVPCRALPSEYVEDYKFGKGITSDDVHSYWYLVKHTSSAPGSVKSSPGSTTSNLPATVHVGREQQRKESLPRPQTISPAKSDGSSGQSDSASSADKSSTTHMSTLTASSVTSLGGSEPHPPPNKLFLIHSQVTFNKVPVHYYVGYDEHGRCLLVKMPTDEVEACSLLDEVKPNMTFAVLRDRKKLLEWMQAGCSEMAWNEVVGHLNSALTDHFKFSMLTLKEALDILNTARAADKRASSPGK
ncbi:hypothetical protein B0T26DRAFT_680014 [Lasiosphaeria miniovina]|uniref:Uncharacterized protein n=1 Tax=Lasiosphaeria miniovina TaxID=1954250 RepID=A0AA40DM49_9PEZI|nr:uncharacterized protein B0T26DRAFT_680014 [Lasiosphaeria miniovina]KAK0706311.1 hypothetical protein B0T26DRAFT_680014 [Lasiosphaeria miniovina]